MAEPIAIRLVQDTHLKPMDYRVLLYLLATRDETGAVTRRQVDVHHTLGYAVPNVSKSFNRLIDGGYLLNGNPRGHVLPPGLLHLTPPAAQRIPHQRRPATTHPST